MQASRTIVLLLTTLLLMAGCSLRAKPKTTQATPSAPKPTVRPAAPPPPEPLSITQTQVKLPQPQPVSEAALATLQEPAAVELPEPPNTRGTRRVITANPPPVPKPEAPPTAAGPALPPANSAAGAPTAAEPERPRIQELVSPTEQKQLTDSLDARKREIRQGLAQATSRGPSAADKDRIDRIRSFVKLSDEALARGDYRQADALAERAQVLARELQGAR